MIRRPVMAAALVTAALVSLCAITPSFAQRQRRPARPNVSLTRPALTPKTVNSGGNLTARVTATPVGGAVVSVVNLRLDRPGSASTFVSMGKSGNVWSKSFSAPANFSGKVVNVSVFAVAQTSVGTKTLKLGVVKVKSTTIDPNQPPPPPPI